jgi:GPH family glycoside/pentoside/hexuronide:cation symporter
MNSYLFKDYFHNTKALTLAGVVSVGCTLLVAPFVATITKKIGKKEASGYTVLFSSVMYLLMFLLPIHNAWVFVGLMFLAGIGVGFFNTVIWAFITDVIDYQEYLTGTREDGTIYSFYSFARKIGQAVAGGLSGFALAAIGYISTPKGQPAIVQTDAVANGIKAFATLTPAICYFIVFLILRFWYPLTKAKLTELEQNLAKKRKTNA